jgi:hypothetical protein
LHFGHVSHATNAAGFVKSFSNPHPSHRERRQSAYEAGRYHIAKYKVHEFLKEMREQFGQDLDEGEALLTNSINDYEARAMFAADCGIALAYSDSITKRKPMPQWEELFQRALERESKTRVTKETPPTPPSARPSPKRKPKA